MIEGRGGLRPPAALILAALLFVVSPLAAQTDYLPALPGYVFEFPRDHGSHEQFKTEWWYYTGHLRTEGGRSYGFEVTFFRAGVVPPGQRRNAGPWELGDIALAHFAVTDPARRQFRYYEKLNRFSRFTAGARAGSLQVFNEGWSATTTADGRMRLRAAASRDAVDLVLASSKPPAIHGENGVSVKAAGVGYASHYYSLTRLTGSGTVTIDGRTEKCTVLAWMDHEFGSSTLREHQAGWDWFSVQLDDGTELMLYQIRRRDGSPDDTSSGSFITSNGNVIPLKRDQFTIAARDRWRSPHSGAVYPMGWTITVPPLGLTLTVREKLRDQELITRSSTQVTYWEGAVDVTGNSGQTPVRGVGYVEMTGYDKPFTQ
jgi:predicted secreted hydrolase